MRLFHALRRVGLTTALCLAAPAFAQEAPPCTGTLATAQAYYVDQEFDVAETLLRECLGRPDVDDATAIEVHRLLALVYLRQDNLSDAKQIVIRLLGIDFDYTPDPVLDPPTYVALVESIKEPLRIEREAAAPQIVVAAPTVPAALSPEPLPVAYRASRSLYAYLLLGTGSYGGERGFDGSWLVEDFAENAGFAGGGGAGFNLTQTLAVSLSYRFQYVPALFQERSGDRLSAVGDSINGDSSSKWLHLASLSGRTYYRPFGRASSYVELGLIASRSRINDAVKTGLGPRGAVGLDYALSRQVGAFAELSAAILLPGDAVDHIDTSGGSDLLSFAELGVRYQIKAW